MSNVQLDQSTRLENINEDEEAARESDVHEEVVVQSGPLEKQGPRKLTSQISTKVRQVTKEFKRMATVVKQGPKQLDRTTSMTAARAIKELQFVNKRVGSDGWAEVEKQFDELSADGLLLRSRFGKCIGMKEKEFAEKLFDALARRRGIVTGTITKPQLRDFWEQLSGHSFEARIQTFFDMVDKNADGLVTKEEVTEIIIVSASANQLWKVKQNADEFADLIMKALDPDAIGYIELQNLETLFLQAPKEADSKKLNKFLSKKLVVTKEPSPIKRAVKKTTYFLEDNWKRIWFMLLWLAICAALFTWKFLQYKHRYVYHVMGGCVATAKGAAETLKFNMALILLPVCRKTVTWLRSRTKLGVAVPFDDNINFHQVVAVGVAVGVAMHVICHLTCDFPRLLHASEPAYAPLAKYFGPNKPDKYYWFIEGTEGWTGITMVTLMLIAFILAQPWFRKNNLVKLPKVVKSLTGFNAFWYSHHLFVIVYALLFVHGWFLYLSKEWYKKTTWMYISVPIFIYTCERMIKALKYTHEKVQLLKYAVYRENEGSGKQSAGNSLSLQMAKPEDFRYSSGQYIFVKCLDVSPFEWHPFSLTSAPEDDYISVHIRDLGDWTKQLISLFSKLPQMPGNSGIISVDSNHKIQVPRMPRLKIDGPYGAPAQDYKNYDVLLLVGLGIGATPLISIVKDVLYHIKQQENIENGIVDEPKHAHPNHGSSSSKRQPFRVKRVYFNWVTREQGSFDWFKNVMNEVAEIDHDHVIEMHNYCSSVHKEGDARSALFTLLQSLQDAKNGLDIVSGTRVKTHFGRANWESVFSHVTDNHSDKRVGVFYCGPTGLVKSLKRLCQDFTTNTTTKFEFHKENF